MEIEETVYIYKLMAGEKLDWHGRYHSHEEGEFEVHFFAEGEGTFYSNNTSYAIKANSLFLTAPREFHSILPKEVKKPLTYYAILFRVGKTEKTLNQFLITSNINCKMAAISDNESAHIKFYLEDILRLSKTSNENMKTSANLLFEGCLYRWFGKSFKPVQVAEIVERKKSAKLYVNKAINMMQKMVSNNCSIDYFASMCGITEEHFIRIFRDEMQMTPHQYYLRLKIQNAALDLINSSKPIYTIAEEFSFENQFHFARVFKKCTGLTPSSYRAAFTLG